MNFRLRHVLGVVGLLCGAFAIVDAEAPHKFLTCLAVSALFGLAFSIEAARRSPAISGAIGAVVGWAVAVAVGHVEFLLGYFSHRGPRPYFEDGVILEVVFLPLFITVVLAVPSAGLGVCIGAVVGLAAWLGTIVHRRFSPPTNGRPR